MCNIRKTMENTVVVITLIGIVIAFGSCSPFIEDNGTSATEALVAETSSSKKATTAPATETTAETAIETTSPVTRQSSVTHNPVLMNSEYRSEDDTLHTDLWSLNLKAKPDDDQAIIQAVRSVYPDFSPTGYSVTKVVNDFNDFFWVHYKIEVGEYVTTKGYQIRFEGNQADKIMECGVSLSVPSASDIAKLPAVTEQIKEAAYQQGREAVHAKNPRFVVQEQRGSAFYNLATGECFYNVRNVYTTSATDSAKGVVDTNYKIT